MISLRDMSNAQCMVSGSILILLGIILAGLGLPYMLLITVGGMFVIGMRFVQNVCEEAEQDDH